MTIIKIDEHIKEPKKHVFLHDYLKSVGKTEGNDVYLSIKEILDIWGYGEFFDEMVEDLYRHVKNNPDEKVDVYYDMGEFDSDKSHQKLLEWNIYDEKKKEYGLVGGVLFHEGEMSFHT